MNEYIQNICEKFVDCRALLGECYKWSSTTDQCLRASFMLKDDTYITESSIQEIKQFLKKREGIFSSLRSHIEMTVIMKNTT